MGFYFLRDIHMGYYEKNKITNKGEIYMFDKFDLFAILSEIIRGKNEKIANIFDTIVGHIFMTILTGGLWLVILMIKRLINKRKQRRA